MHSRYAIINNLRMKNNNLYTWNEKDIRGNVTVYDISKACDLKEGKLKFSYSSGNKYCDLIFCGRISSFLLSSRIIDLLFDNNITGWKAHPAIIYDKKNRIIDGYFLFEIIGKSGVIDWNKSDKFKKQFVSNAPFAEMVRGIYPDLSFWDGSDIFMAEGSLFIFMTEKVKDLFIKNRVTNVNITKTTEFEMIELLTPLDVEMEERANSFFR
jgi:hypothetical protein